MTGAWILYSLAIGVLVAAAALALEGACRAAGRPTRWPWAVGLALTLALTVTAPRRTVAPPAMLPLPETSSAVAAAPAPVPDAWSTLRITLAGVRAATVAPLERALRGAPRLSPRAERAVALGWLVVASALVALLVGVHARLASARRRWPARELHGVPVRVAPNAGPVVVGVARPEIVVPRWLLDRDADEQRLAVTHEREHLRARDPLLIAGAWAACALLFWHPLAWWMLARLRLAVELDCDRRVLRGGVPTRRYGTMLIDLAGRCAGVRLGMPALADGPSHLERRLVAMTSHRTRFARAHAGLLATAAAIALLAACAAQLPTDADVASMDAASATKAAGRLALLTPDDSGPVFFVDGERASSERANALHPDEIASVNVYKEANGARSRVEIVTNAGLPSAKLRADTVRFRVKVAGSDTGYALLVTTKRLRDSSMAPVAAEPMAGRPLPSKRAFTGIIMIDGVKSDDAALARLAPADIESVEVLKGAAAARLYGAAAANGVITVTTKHAASKK